MIENILFIYDEMFGLIIMYLIKVEDLEYLQVEYLYLLVEGRDDDDDDAKEGVLVLVILYLYLLLEERGDDDDDTKETVLV